MSHDERLEELLDRAVDEIRNGTPGTGELAAAKSRVHAHLNEAAQERSVPHAALSGLDDYLALIPAYLAGELPAAKSLLLEEEARRSIPLRRALQTARESQKSEGSSEREASREEGRGWQRWLAAAAVLGAVVASLFALPWLVPVSQGQIAQVSAIDGTLFRVDGDQLRPLAVGTSIDGRQELRTAKDSSAVLSLDDGSIVEVDERSSLELLRQRQGDRIVVDRGRIIVQASEQGSGSLRVTTEELRVAVKGTVFAVAHGTKGSRVSVIEGEVEVRKGRELTSLLPGEQVGSRESLTTASIEDDFAWGSDVDRYIALLQELVELRRDLNELMVAENRYSTRLLDLAPADAAVYVAVPNATAKLAEAYDLIRERVASAPDLAEVWQEFEGSPEQQKVDWLVDQIRELSQYLGEETVVAVTLGEGGGPLLMSEVLDPVNFRTALEQKLAAIAMAQAAEAGETDETSLPIYVVDDPSEATGAGIAIWLVDDLLIASPVRAQLEQTQANLASGASAFVGTEFYGLLASAYGEGAQFLAAVDLAALVGGEDEAALEAIGLANARHFIAQRRQFGDRAETTAELSFEGERRGLASWLAEPGPMGALEFFSPDTTVVSAFVVREPGDLLDDILQLAAADGEDVDAALDTFEQETGLSLRDDVFAPLGGEFAMGMDGPALPEPSWKLVFEVYDELRLQQTVGLLIERVNQEAAARGAEYSMTLDEITDGGRTYFLLSGDVPDDSEAAAFEGMMEVVWTYADGYFVAAPSRTLVERAVQYYESGASLVTAEEFQSLLPVDGYLDFSGVVYNRLGEMLAQFFDRVPSGEALTAEQQQAIDELRSESGASLYCVYGERDKIRFVSHGPNELPLAGLSQMLGFGSVIEGIGAATPFADLVRPAGVRFGHTDEADPLAADGGITWQ